MRSGSVLLAVGTPDSVGQAHLAVIPRFLLPCSSLRVAGTFTSQPGPFATNVAIQTQRLTLDCVGLTAFSHDFGEVEAIVR